LPDGALPVGEIRGPLGGLGGEQVADELNPYQSFLACENR
jgi:hypothetical protein